MKRLSFAVVSVSLLLIGCLAGTAVSSLVVPAVRAGTNPQLWEYKCFSEHRLAAIEYNANVLGRAGFEMAGAAGDMNGEKWCFKRPL